MTDTKKHDKKEAELDFVTCWEDFGKALRSHCHSAPEEAALLIKAAYTDGHLNQGEYVASKNFMAKAEAVRAGEKFTKEDCEAVVALTDKVNKKHKKAT